MAEKTRNTLISRFRSLLGLFDQPNPAYVLGIDTSHWTGIVNWQMAWEAGIRFAIIKFMDGKTRTRYAEENYRGAKDVGMMVGPYQWLRKAIEVSPGGQAREYAAMIADHPADIRPAVDYEWSPAGTAYNVDSGDLYGFVLPFADTYGKRPMIYSALGYVMQYPLPAIYANDPFWQARYGGPPLSVPPWGLNWKFHQWTASGEGVKYGVDPNFEKSVDLNYWCGTLDELYDWCGKTVEPKPEVNTIVVKVASDGDVRLQSVLLNGADETAHSSIVISPITPPPPPPPMDLYDIKIRTVEWFEQPAPVPPAPGSFAIIGGRGIQNWLAIGPKEVAFIRSIKLPAANVDNDLIWKWACGGNFTGMGKTVYYGFGLDGAGFYRWGIGLMSSALGHPRQYCAINGFDPARKYQRVKGIPHQASGDYSAWTPDKHPEMWFFVPTIYPTSQDYPNGRIGWDSHNGTIFLMPFFQAGSGFKQSADATAFGGQIATTVFLGPHK